MTNSFELEELLQDQLFSLHMREMRLHKAEAAIAINRIIQEGLSGGCLKTLEESIPRSILAAAIGISPSQFKRLYSRSLPAADADKLYALTKIWPLIINFFEGDKDLAEKWLWQECPAIDGAIPAKLLATVVGHDIIQTLITRMSYGDFV